MTPAQWQSERRTFVMIGPCVWRSMAKAAAVGLAVFCGVHSLANDSVRECRERLDDGDVFDFFLIRDVAFLTRSSRVHDQASPVQDLQKVISPDAAVRKGRPDGALKKFIERLTWPEFDMELAGANLTRLGDGDLVWTIAWELYPATGFFSGCPDQFHAVVGGSGELVPPEAYLFDDMEARDTEDPDRTLRLFSVLAVDDLLPLAEPVIDEKRILDAASNAFDEAVADLKLANAFRPLPPRRTTVPGRLALGDADAGDREVWAVRFVSKAIEKPKDVDYGASIVIWVTSDLKTSTITEGMWKARRLRAARREQPDVELNSQEAERR